MILQEEYLILSHLGLELPPSGIFKQKSLRPAQPDTYKPWLSEYKTYNKMILWIIISKSQEIESQLETLELPITWTP